MRALLAISMLAAMASQGGACVVDDRGESHVAPPTIDAFLHNRARFTMSYGAPNVKPARASARVKARRAAKAARRALAWKRRVRA